MSELNTVVKRIAAKTPGLRSLVAKWKKTQQKLEKTVKKVDSLESYYDQMESLKREVAELYAGLTFMEQEVECSRWRHQQSIQGSPKVSIIIVSENDRIRLENLIHSLATTEFYENYEIVCIDNASCDASAEYLSSQGASMLGTVHLVEDRMSFSAALNLGASLATGDLLVFLGTGVMVTEKWLDSLILAYQSVARPGAIGAELRTPLISANEADATNSFRIQSTGIAFKGVLDGEKYLLQPYDIDKDSLRTASFDCEPKQRAAVSAIALLTSKLAFDEVGGFSKSYEYGYGDVDYCLKLIKAGRTNYYCPASTVFYGGTRFHDFDADMPIQSGKRDDLYAFNQKWASWLEEVIVSEKLSNALVFTEQPLSVAIVVTEAKVDTAAGDYFTALELGNALRKMGFKVKLLPRWGGSDWYNIGTDVDVVVSLLESYNISKIYNHKADLIKIAWARNQFERWCSDVNLDLFDIVLASSKRACAYLAARSKQVPQLFPLATNAERFYRRVGTANRDRNDRDEGRADYVFTGSYWGSDRDIIKYLNPGELPYKGKIFGANWEEIEKFEPIYQGFASYADMPNIYWNTKLVIDDANHTTKEIGSVNSRVFDALAAGALVITNGKAGSDDTFEGLLPTYSSEDGLEKMLAFYLENEEERINLAAQLQKLVISQHTYDIRAKELIGIITQYVAESCPVNVVDVAL